jgi:hypothetical protein
VCSSDLGYITAIVKKRWETWKERVSNRLIYQAEETFRNFEEGNVVEKNAESMYKDIEEGVTIRNTNPKGRIKF